MSETPTPRTDAECENASNIALWCDTGKHGFSEATHATVVQASFCRQLERENQALREAVEKLMEDRNCWCLADAGQCGYCLGETALKKATK